jgi:hypothetical protein
MEELNNERKTQLKKISQLRGNRALLTIAAALTKKAPISIDYDDLLPISDQLENLQGDKIDIILETPGGIAEIVEDIIVMVRNRFKDVAFMIPGHAKSAGTIMVMAGDDILMEPGFSALGPIDAQILQNGKRFSAEAFLKGLGKIKGEVSDTGTLNKAYIPILQNISPGEIQACENALEFAKNLVTKWLCEYKFANWKSHKKSGKEVTEQERKDTAYKISSELCNHSRWLTHGRSIKLKDLEEMGLRITDYSRIEDLNEAIRRYHTLLQMTFETTNMYKLFETPDSQIYRFSIEGAVPPPRQIDKERIEKAEIDFQCPNCKKISKLQANFKPGVALKSNNIEFPKNNIFKCPFCQTTSDITGIRRQIELQLKKSIL